MDHLKPIVVASQPTVLKNQTTCNKANEAHIQEKQSPFLFIPEKGWWVLLVALFSAMEEIHQSSTELLVMASPNLYFNPSLDIQNHEIHICIC